MGTDSWAYHALDFGLPEGTDVIAPADGTVAFTRSDVSTNQKGVAGAPSNYVTLYLDDGNAIMFQHLQHNSVVVKPGQKVKRGDKLAKSGNTGNSTGPHLHVAYQTQCGSWGCPSIKFPNWVEGNIYALTAYSSYVTSQNCPDAGGNTVTCTPTTEICDGKDNNCNGKIDENEVCEGRQSNDLLYQANAYDAYSSDFNGDGKADLCARDASGFVCKLSNGNGFGDTIKLVPGMSNDNDFANSTYNYYRTIRMADINGDGKADICARTASAYICYPSTGNNVGSAIKGPAMENAVFADPKYYTTIRMADINGDGKDDICARFSDGFKCALSKGSTFDALGAPAVGLSDANGFGVERFYATIRMADINGDGKADLCNLENAGFVCRLSDGKTFPSGDSKILGPAWTGTTWANATYYASIRMPDINGDGKADVCARDADGLVCYLSEGNTFSKNAIRGDWPDKNGWNNYMYYSTIQYADLNGDGKDDVCGRASSGLVCYLSNGSGFDKRFTLAHFSDANGYNEAINFRTIRLADMNGDNMADVCGRNSQGEHCFTSTGNGFSAEITGPAWSDANGWNSSIYTTTIRFGSAKTQKCVASKCTKPANANSMACDAGKCVVAACDAGYELSSNKQSCTKAIEACDANKCAKPANATTMACSNNKCIVTACDANYVVSSDMLSCTYVPPCSASACTKPENATEMACNSDDQCIVSKCADGYDITFDKLSCEKVNTCIATGDEICDDGIDNDCNGFVDMSDSACICSPSEEICNDGIDNDCDGITDENEEGNTCKCTPSEEICGDEIDNDCNGQVDENCEKAECTPTNNYEICGDGIDNDCNGQIDEACRPGCVPSDSDDCMIKICDPNKENCENTNPSEDCKDGNCNETPTCDPKDENCSTDNDPKPTPGDSTDNPDNGNSNAGDGDTNNDATEVHSDSCSTMTRTTPASSLAALLLALGASLSGLVLRRRRKENM